MHGNPDNQFTQSGDVALTWNGVKWRVIRENKSDALAGVSCLSSSSCLAVGSYLSRSDETVPLAQSWSGNSWRPVNPPRVIGTYVDARNHVHNMAIRLNGSTWTVLAMPGIGPPAVVSCSRPSSCVAVGSDGNLALSERWNGSSWQLLKESNP